MRTDRVNMNDTVKLTDKKNTLIIAHRGASGLERENTISAFVAACNRTYYGSECDVHVTADGKYVVYHDDDTGRLCDKKLTIEESGFSELRALQVKESGKEEFGETQKIPTLQEYLDVMARYGKVAVIELKNRIREENLREIVEICKARYSLDKIVFISFFFENLTDLRKLLPEQNAQFLTGEYSEEIRRNLVAHKIDLDIGFWALTEEIIADLHAHGRKVNCWTCDEADKAQTLIGWGVDYITSNILE